MSLVDDGDCSDKGSEDRRAMTNVLQVTWHLGYLELCPHTRWKVTVAWHNIVSTCREKCRCETLTENQLASMFDKQMKRIQKSTRTYGKS